MPEKRKVIIQINGVKYPITTSEPEEYVQELSREIEKSVRQLMDGSHISINEALVLLCLGYLDSYQKAEQTADSLRTQIAEYLEEASKSRAEAMEAKKEITRLENQLKGKSKV